VDRTGGLKAFGVVDLRVLGAYDWRLAETNVWKVERLLFAIPHTPLPYSRDRLARLRRRYRRFVEDRPGQKPMYYDRRAWTALPRDAAFDWQSAR
jgi:hypothetical protein